jgi:diaminopropionate ammonia-lyase
MQTPEHRAALHGITVTCATAGNHGRAVAWGAQLCGCSSVIFIPAGAGAARANALTALGARVVPVDGGYDDALRAATSAAAEHGWHVISDTSTEGDAATTADVMDGYALLFQELADELPRDAHPSHLFVQAGVGSLAAAACSFVARAFGSAAPTVVIVEPASAACLMASARSGELVTLTEPVDTIMGGLACRAPSPLAWERIEPVAEYFLSISDDATRRAMRDLAIGIDGDRSIVAGPSGAAGVAGLIEACSEQKVRTQLGLTRGASVIVIATEAAAQSK